MHPWSIRRGDECGGDSGGDGDGGGLGVVLGDLEALGSEWGKKLTPGEIYGKSPWAISGSGCRSGGCSDGAGPISG